VPLRIYDTLTREKREFVPVTPGRVSMYVCGMTVQNKPHVGHIRASLSGEVMRRYLEHLGYQVHYAYNFTDVDDKIIERAGAEGVEWQAVSERNIEAYLRTALAGFLVAGSTGEAVLLDDSERARLIESARQAIPRDRRLVVGVDAGSTALALGQGAAEFLGTQGDPWDTQSDMAIWREHIGAPEGIARLQKEHPDVPIYLAAIDDHLNANAYIVPGLGDAGDRLFGTR